MRTASLLDVPRLVELNARAYPDLVADGVVFDAAQLMAQQAVFPEGQLITEDGLGAMATLIVSEEAAMRPHSWVEICSHGTFACHDPKGSVLYLADVYVDPSAHGRGIGQELYRALFDLCKRKRLSKIVAGGRLWAYHEVADRLTPEQYVAEVIRGERKDRVLTSQLRAGFSVHGILPGYLDDWRSGSFATHLVWENRAYGVVNATSSSQKPQVSPSGKSP